jgi:CheY-like chemotaxis protein
MFLGQPHNFGFDVLGFDPTGIGTSCCLCSRSGVGMPPGVDLPGHWDAGEGCYEAARQVRRIPGLENTVLAALTGWDQQENRHRALEAGFGHHMVKPVELAALQQLLAQAQPQDSDDP